MPLRRVPKAEREALEKKIREMSREDMINMFVEKGWSLESSVILTDAMKEGIKK